MHEASRQETMYRVYGVDASGQTLDAAQHRYTLRFAPGELPPVSAFWALSMYEIPSSLVANPFSYCLINSPMQPNYKRDADAGLTLYVQHAFPGKDKGSNWLPAPNGPFVMFMHLDWPKRELLNASWSQPPLLRVK